MTAVPKPLKFLRSHFASLVESHGAMTEGENRKTLADVISVLAMTSGKEEERYARNLCALCFLLRICF